MFYQNNNDYMRDAFYYSQPQNNTYQYNGMNSCMPINNGTMQPNPYMNSFASQNSVQNMYPQVYRIIDPVAKRVVSNNYYQYYTEDSLNNMVDTVYNIVEGDVSTLSNTNSEVVSDDTVSQGPTRNSTQTSTTKQTASTTTVVTSQTSSNDNQLLKDLIKIVIIKEILSRQNTGCSMNNIPQNYYNSGYMGMM